MGMAIREATLSDLPSLLRVGAEFARLHPMQVAFSPCRAEATLRGLIERADGLLLVGEEDGLIRGVLAGIMAPLWFSDASVATELALWVQPDRRGGRLVRQLIEAFEGWAARQGAEILALSDLRIGEDFPVGALYSRLGYRVAERSHIKEA
jgi:GNAT superfamily N-acetyltransferase